MQITRGLICGALKVVVYGPEGIGKSTFASQFPDPVFIDTEGSTKFMNVARTPAPSSWAMLLDQVQYFKSHTSGCKTLVIDTADWAERMCTKGVCEKFQKSGIEDFGYGKGYTYVYEEFGKLLNLLEDIVQLGVNVLMTAHAVMRKFEQPDEMGSYDRWELKLNNSQKCSVANMAKEWADVVLFANYKTFVVNVDNQGAQKGKNKAQGGKRVMYTAHHPCWDAKNRHCLGDELPFEFAQIAHLFDMKVAPTAPVNIPRPETAAPVAAPRYPVPPQSTPDAASAPQPPNLLPQPEKPAAFTEMPETIAPENDRTGIPRALLDLMDEAKILPYEVEAAVAKKHIFPADMRIRDMPLDYINGVLVGAWAQVRKSIEEDPNRVPF